MLDLSVLDAYLELNFTADETTTTQAMTDAPIEVIEDMTDTDPIHLEASNEQMTVKSARSNELRNLSFPTGNQLPCYKGFHQEIRGFAVDKYDMATLERKRFVNDNIINTFIAIQVDKAKQQGFSIMAFETILTSQMTQKKLSEGYQN